MTLEKNNNERTKAGIRNKLKQMKTKFNKEKTGSKRLFFRKKRDKIYSYKQIKYVDIKQINIYF